MLEAVKVKAVIFDLDGVIVQSERLSWQIWQEYLQEIGKELSEEDYRQMIGTHNGAEFIKDRLNLPDSAEAIAREHLDRALSAIEGGVEVTEGIEPLLSDLVSRSLPLAVASNSIRPYVPRTLEIAGLAHYFRTVVTREEVPDGKPSPDVYLEAAARLDIPSEHCMAVEDSPAGLQAALAAGMLSIAVPNQDLRQFSFDGAHSCFNSIMDLHNNLDSLLSGHNYR